MQEAHCVFLHHGLGDIAQLVSRKTQDAYRTAFLPVSG